MKGKKSVHKTIASNHHERNARAVLSLIVLLLAFAMLWVFSVQSYEIISSGSFNIFVILLTVGLCLLLSLLFLATPRKK